MNDVGHWGHDFLKVDDVSRKLQSAILKLGIPDVHIDDLGSGNGIRTFSTGGRDRNFSKFDVFTSDIEPLEADFPFVTEYDDEEEFLHPFRRVDIPEYWDKIEMRASREMMPGHFLNLSNSLMVLRLSIGWVRSRTLRPLRILRYYLESVHKLREPFSYKARGQVRVSEVDSAAPIRILTLINAAFWQVSHRDVLSEDLVDELVRYVVKDPFANSKEIKNHLTATRQSFGALSTEGWGVRWHAVENEGRTQLQGFKLEEIAKLGNDYAYYKLIEKEVDGELEWIKKKGLLHLYKLANRGITGSVDRDLVRLWAAMFMFEGLAGFTRTYMPRSAAKQITPQTDIPDDPQFRDDLKDVWYEATSQCIDQELFPSFQAFRAMVPSILTTKSAGADRLSVSVPIKEDSGVRKIARSGKLELSFTDKLTIFLTDPEYYLSRSAAEERYTVDMPGRIAGRDVVGGKSSRSIFPRWLQHFIFESSFTVAFNTLGENDPELSVGKDVGNVLIDHATGIYSSSDPSILIQLSDYSAFDTHQRENNARRFAREAVIAAMLDAGLNGRWGEFENGLPEVVELMWGEGITHNAHFVVSSSGLELTLIVDQLTSGEFITLFFNSMTNKALTRQIKDKSLDVLEIRNCLSFWKNFIMGDDSTMFWKIINVAGYSTELLMLLSKVAIACGVASGFVLNFLKTATRVFYYEYLKKRAIYGYLIPLLLVQVFSSERSDADRYPIELLISYCSKLAQVAGRGGDSTLISRIIMYTWMHKAIRIQTKDVDMKGRRVTEQYYPPLAVLWLPISMGGIGQIPWCPYSPSKDALIAYYTTVMPEFKLLLNKAAHIVKVPKENVKSEISRMLYKRKLRMMINDEPMVERIPLAPGLTYLNNPEIMPISRRKAASKAYHELLAIGIKVPKSLYYNNFAESRIEKAVSGAPQLNVLETLSKNRMAKMFLRNVSTYAGEDLIDIQFPWVKRMRFIPLDLLDQKMPNPNPFAYADLRTFVCICAIGLAARENIFSLRPSVFLNILRKDPYFPRHLTEEQIFFFLTQPRLVWDQQFILKGLLAIGARPDLAEIVSARIYENLAQFLFMLNSQTFSFNDELGVLLDLSSENHARILEVVELPNPSIMSLLKEMGMLFAFIDGFRNNEWRRVRIEVSQDIIPELMRDLVGKYVRPELMLLHKYLPKAHFE